MGKLSKASVDLIEQKATQFGETPDALIHRVFGEAPRRRFDPEEVRRIQRRVAALPVLDDRPLKELRDSLWE